MLDNIISFFEEQEGTVLYAYRYVVATHCTFAALVFCFCQLCDQCV